MDIGREVKALRSSLITVKSSLEQTHSPELHYLTKELEKQLISLNNIDQCLNKPNVTMEDFSQTQDNTTTSSFTLVFDNRKAFSQIDLSMFNDTVPRKSNSAQNPS